MWSLSDVCQLNRRYDQTACFLLLFAQAQEASPFDDWFSRAAPGIAAPRDLQSDLVPVILVPSTLVLSLSRCPSLICVGVGGGGFRQKRCSSVAALHTPEERITPNGDAARCCSFDTYSWLVVTQ